MPEQYQHMPTARRLDVAHPTSVLVQTDYDLEALLDVVSLPQDMREYITAAIELVGDGDIEAVWLSEAGNFYDLNAIFHPLPYYKSDELSASSNLPAYWQEENPLYIF